MSSVVIAGDVSGSVTLQAPSASGTTTLTLPATSGTVSLNGPAFSAYQSVAQTALTSSTWTKLLFQTKTFDTNNNFASSTFTPTVAGYYQLNGIVQINTGSTGACGIAIYKNGTTYIQQYFSGSGIGYPSQNVSGLVFLNGTTDYVEIYGYSATSASPSANSFNTQFSASFARAA